MKKSRPKASGKIKVVIKLKITTKKTAIKKKTRKVRKAPKIFGQLLRIKNNPIIAPRLYSWESKATFNPTAFMANGKIHLIYRAIGEDDSSVLGYASTKNGRKILERPTNFIYKRFNEPVESISSSFSINYTSGGGWNGGSEDPRVTLIGDILYMLYTSFDGWGSVRIALTSIKLEDFKKKKWEWKKPVLISPPGEINKNWVIFPEKINGKFAILHSFYPKILVDYFDSLDEFDGKKYIKSDNTRPVDKTRTWDSWFRGVGPSPIKTSMGWLILYHAMDHNNPDRYRMGAIILDLNNPTRMLYRSSKPILEPKEWYENEGYKRGVVYSCGAVVKDGELFVYYGGADTVVCVASISIEELLRSLKKDKVVKLKNNKLLETEESI